MAVIPKDLGYSLFTVKIGQDFGEGVFAMAPDHRPAVPQAGEHRAVDEHDSHEIHVVVSGSGWFHLGDGTDLLVTAGQVVVLPSRVRHQFFTDRAVYLLSCEMRPSVFKPLLTYAACDPVTTALARTGPCLAPRVSNDPYLYNAFLELFEQGMSEIAHNDKWRPAALALLSQHIAINIQRLLQADPGMAHDSTALRVLHTKIWMDRHFCEALALPLLADMTHLSPSHFSKLFHRLVGTTPKAYLLQRRLQQAALLLADTRLPVTDVALSVGFDYPTNFSRTFTQAFGVSPAAYRQKAQLNREKC